MTNGYVINIGNASAKQWVTFGYEKTLNGMSNAQIGLDGVSSVYSSEFDAGNEMKIYKNGTLKFRGLIIDKEDLTGGGVVLIAQGIEVELADKKAPTSGNISRTWTSTSDNTIINDLVTSVSGWTTDVSNSTGTVLISFRVTATESVWNAIIRLIEQTGRDIWIDQTNKVVYLYDDLTTAGQFTFIEGKNSKNISRKKSRSRAGKVLVYGKGDGEFQIIGSSGSGTPEHVIIDRNILTTAEANNRATVEYNRLNPNSLSYTFEPIILIDSLDIGDSGTITNNSAGINETVDIVRIKIVVDGNGTEKNSIEVTNPDYRIASKNQAEILAAQNAKFLQTQSSMQGSGNTLTWARGINANNTYALSLPFNIPSDYITDEAGNIRIESFTLDYDVDPYKKGVGGASFAGADPQVQNSSASFSPDVTDNSGSESANGVSGSSSSTEIISLEGTDSFTSTAINTTWENVMTEAVNGTFEMLYAYVQINADFSGTDDLHLRIRLGSTNFKVTDYFLMNTGVDSNLRRVYAIPVFASVSDTVYIDLASSGGQNYNGTLSLYQQTLGHTHADGTYAAASHTHTDGTYAAANHPHADGTYDINASDLNNITIGDSVSDAASINATEVNIYLDFWNGSTWVNKHTILATGATLETDVDLSNSGVYPDAAGYWRVRVLTDSASADYVQSIVKIKHNLDN